MLKLKFVSWQSKVETFWTFLKQFWVFFSASESFLIQWESTFSKKWMYPFWDDMSFSKWCFCYEMFPLYKLQSSNNSFPLISKSCQGSKCILSWASAPPTLGHIFLYKQGIAPLFRMKHWTSALVILLDHLITC